MSTYLITGGTGFMGKALVQRLLEMGASRVVVFSRDEYKQSLMRATYARVPELRFFVGDVRDARRLERALEGIDVVLHTAALKRVEVGEYDASEMVKTNVDGMMNVIDAAHWQGVKKVIALSTDKAFQPVNAYGASKLMMEKLVLAANNSRGKGGPRFSVTRYGNVAGSTGSVIPTWRALLTKGDPIVVRDLRATRFWMTRDQAVKLVLDAASNSVGGELIIPELPAYQVGDLASAMAAGADFTATGLGPGEKLHEGLDEFQSSDQVRRMTVAELREELELV